MAMPGSAGPGFTNKAKAVMAFRSGATIADRLRDLSRLPRPLALARLGYGLKHCCFVLPFYDATLSGTVPTALRFIPSDPWPGNADRGGAITQDELKNTKQAPNQTPPALIDLESKRDWNPAHKWLPEFHNFSWLRDLRATGGDTARRCARDLVTQWMADNNRWCATAWQPLTTGQRLANWFGQYEFFAASGAIEFRHRLFDSMARQARHLYRVLPMGLTGADAIAALKGLIYAGACLPGGKAWLDHGLTLLLRELPKQLFADGGHAERNPSRHLAVLRDLIDLRAVLGGAGVNAPAELQLAIDRMAPMLRLFRHGDGGLAQFNGSGEEESWQIDMVLQRANGGSRPLMSAPQSGFQRLHAGRTVVLIDTGAPPLPGLDSLAQAGTLSFELSTGRERLIVNCGAQSDNPAWRRALAATAAHSTAVLQETNSSQVLSSGGLGRRPATITCRRDEADGNIWLDMSHDGYQKKYGAVHHRRLYLSANGNDLRGEDRFEPMTGGDWRIRFHLHPQVRASLAAGGHAVLLRTAKGAGWRFLTRNVRVDLAPSIYLSGKGETRRSQQIVLSAQGARHGAVQWALTQVTQKR